MSQADTVTDMLVGTYRYTLKLPRGSFVCCEECRTFSTAECPYGLNVHPYAKACEKLALDGAKPFRIAQPPAATVLK